MDYSLFFNHLSLPASNLNEAYSLLIDAFQGALYLNQNDDRFVLYSDDNSIDDCILAENFTYSDFKNRLADRGENDLLSFIYEIEDKSPFLDHISNDYINELTECLPYFSDRPYDANLDIFHLALLENGIMLSLATEKYWQNYTIIFFISREGEDDDRCQVYNISGKAHAASILDDLERTLLDVCPNATFTGFFNEWYADIKREDRGKIRNILRHCHEHNFQLGRPIIDTINDSQYPNMKEIRAGNPYGQRGKIRILFAMDTDRRPAILVGFIKHGSDYSKHINTADNLFQSILQE